MDIITAERAEPGEGIGYGVDSKVADVQGAGGIGEHGEDVSPLFQGIRLVFPSHSLLAPFALPFLVQVRQIELAGGASSADQTPKRRRGSPEPGKTTATSRSRGAPEP